MNSYYTETGFARELGWDNASNKGNTTNNSSIGNKIQAHMDIRQGSGNN